MSSDTKKRIGILRGGSGSGYESSLKRGGEVILYIHENLAEKYKPVDIFIDQDYIWHVNGLPVNPGDLVSKVDIVWNISHPSLSNILESLFIPNIGVSSFSHALGNNREMLREHMKGMGVSMPRHIVLPLYQEDFDGEKSKYAIKKAKEIFEKFGSPWVVKSFTPDSSMGIHLAKTFGELVSAIADGVNHEKSILVEEFISGQVGAMHSVSNFRNEPVYVFPVSGFNSEDKDKLTSLAKTLHTHIDANNYLKVDFVLDKRGKVHITSIEFLPDLRPDSHFHQAVESVGAKMHHVVEHILEGVLL